MGSTGPISLDTNGQNVTFNSGLASTNTAGLTKMGSGILTITASQNYSGPTLISGGTVQFVPAAASACILKATPAPSLTILPPMGRWPRRNHEQLDEPLGYHLHDRYSPDGQFRLQHHGQFHHEL